MVPRFVSLSRFDFVHFDLHRALWLALYAVHEDGSSTLPCMYSLIANLLNATNSNDWLLCPEVEGITVSLSQPVRE